MLPGQEPMEEYPEVDQEAPRPREESTRAWVGLVVGMMVGVKWYLVM